MAVGLLNTYIRSAGPARIRVVAPSLQGAVTEMARYARRSQLIALLSGAVVSLFARILVDEVGGPAILERGLYLLAVACLAGCLVVIMRARQQE
mgnify:CR=1 FL=1